MLRQTFGFGKNGLVNNIIDENLEKQFKKTVRDDSQKYKADLEEHKKLEKTTGKKSKATKEAEKNLKAYEDLVSWRKKDWEATEAAKKQFEKEMENAEYLIS